MSKKSVAARLLLAETVHQQAVNRHSEERTELSRRVLAEAARELEEAERAAAAHLSHPLRCKKCGWLPIGFRWSADAVPTVAPEEGVELRLLPHGATPDWAAQYAVQGVARVTRYECPECQQVLAVLAD